MLENPCMDEEERTGSGSCRVWWGRRGEATDRLILFGVVKCYCDFLYRLLIYFKELHYCVPKGAKS
jgi:hypothetical protein